MWIHFDNVSINLAVASHIVPGPDGILTIHYLGGFQVTIDSQKAVDVCKVLKEYEIASYGDSWHAKRIAAGVAKR
jgi:hypothetical protein